CAVPAHRPCVRRRAPAASAEPTNASGGRMSSIPQYGARQPEGGFRAVWFRLRAVPAWDPRAGLVRPGAAGSRWAGLVARRIYPKIAVPSRQELTQSVAFRSRTPRIMMMDRVRPFCYLGALALAALLIAPQGMAQTPAGDKPEGKAPATSKD